MFFTCCSPVKSSGNPSLPCSWSKAVPEIRDFPRLAYLLQPGRDVDAVAEQIVTLDHHVAEIDPDAVDEALFGRGPLLAFRHALLHCDRERDGVDDRAELGDEPVAHRLDDPPAVLGKKRIDGLGSNVFQSREGGTFVGFDLARIPHHVGGEYGGEPPHRTFHCPLPCERAFPCGVLHKSLLKRSCARLRKTTKGGGWRKAPYSLEASKDALRCYPKACGCLRFLNGSDGHIVA